MAGLVGCRSLALAMVERLPVGLVVMIFDANCVQMYTALWAPKRHQGSFNPIKALSAHKCKSIREDLLATVPLNHPRRRTQPAIDALRQYVSVDAGGRVGCRNLGDLQARGAIPLNHLRRHRVAARRALRPYARVFFKEIRPFGRMCLGGMRKH